jgi:uncharacterized protein YndB with AHSA1/START domain
MQTLEYSIQINAPKHHVWFVLWNDFYYRKWTTVFCPGSYYKGNLSEGAEIQFLTPDHNGMHSIVHKVVENEVLHFLHQGDIVKGEKVATNWQNAREYYAITEANGVTTLQVTHDVVPEYIDYMNTHFPKALAIVKEIVEDFYISLETEIHAPIETVWHCYTQPEHIMQWNQATEDWHCPKAQNNLTAEGTFCYTMAAKDGSMAFDYTQVDVPHTLSSLLDDNRKVDFLLCENEGITHVLQRFQPESENTLDLQKMGWGSILESFKAYCENLSAV